MPPKAILLMRHAEEPEGSKDPDLSPAGRIRAEKLAPFILATYGKPDHVFAAAINKHSSRACLTMRPLCDATGVPLDASLPAKH